MSVAYEFLKDEEFDGNLEDNINFIIDHYHEAIMIYRVMKQQTEISNKKKKESHLALKELRDIEEQLRKDGKTLNEQEKLELSEKKKFHETQREREDSIFYMGNELEYNKLTYLVLKHHRIFEYLDKMDRRGRNIVGGGSKVLSSVLLWPLKKMCGLVSNQTDSEKAYLILTRSEETLENIPNKIKDHIIQKDINLNDHILKKSKDKKKDKDFEISFTL